VSHGSIALYDAINLEAIPPAAPAVAGYVDGRWPTYHLLRDRWPRAHLLSIAVRASSDAAALDVEQGDAEPADAANWVLRQLKRGLDRPVLYASVSAMQPLIDTVLAHGVKRGQFRLWTAHYTGRAHLCSRACGFGFHDQAGATQWTDRAEGRSLDQSLVFDASWFPHVRG
jgi:hypothetical protein